MCMCKRSYFMVNVVIFQSFIYILVFTHFLKVLCHFPWIYGSYSSTELLSGHWHTFWHQFQDWKCKNLKISILHFFRYLHSMSLNINWDILILYFSVCGTSLWVQSTWKYVLMSQYSYYIINTFYLCSIACRVDQGSEMVPKLARNWAF